MSLSNKTDPNIVDGRKCFYDPNDFDFVKILYENKDAIKKELSQLTNDGFVLFVFKKTDGEKDVFGIYGFGRKMEENAKKCPITTKVVESIPGMTMAGFSSLKPGTHIVPHKGYEGYSDSILRLHLGLLCPESGCGIRVGNITKTWKEGEILIFDDFIEHEAWNKSNQTRIILLVDFKYNKEGRNPDIHHAKFTSDVMNLIKDIDSGKLK